MHVFATSVRRANARATALSWSTPVRLAAGAAIYAAALAHALIVVVHALG